MGKKISGLIVAAGMSSRMEAFKPLLRLGEKTIIEHAVDNLIAGGTEEIIVVTGNRAEELEEQLRAPRIKFIRNENYAKTSMFDSVKLGLQYIQNRCDEFFFLPGDIPLFRGHSLRAMDRKMGKMDCQVVQPAYLGKHGHPVLFSADCIKYLINYDGPNGLKGAMEGLKFAKIDLQLPDRGILMDADTHEDYKKLYEYYLNMERPEPETCIEILKYFGTEERVIRHCTEVAKLAGNIALRLSASGHVVDVQLIEAAAMLHDAARGEENHAEVGAQWLQELEFNRLADIVRVHMELPPESVEALDESAIVYLADKLFVETRRVKLEERFLKTAGRFKEDEAAMRSVRLRMERAMEILHRVEEKIGEIQNENVHEDRPDCSFGKAF